MWKKYVRSFIIRFKYSQLIEQSVALECCVPFVFGIQDTFLPNTTYLNAFMYAEWMQILCFPFKIGV